MSDTKYLAQVAEWDHIDYDDALSAEDLAASLAPDMARDAERYQMIAALAAEDNLFTDEPGPLTLAAHKIATDLDDKYPDAVSAEQMPRMLDALIAEFWRN